MLRVTASFLLVASIVNALNTTSSAYLNSTASSLSSIFVAKSTTSSSASNPTGSTSTAQESTDDGGSNATLLPTSSFQIGSTSPFSASVLAANISISGTAGSISSAQTTPMPVLASQNVTVTANATSNGKYGAADACNLASQSWSSLYGTNTTISTPSTLYAELMTYIPPANATPYTTLCDGTPRAHVSASNYLATSVYSYDVNVTSLTAARNAAMPTYTIDGGGCASLWSSFDCTYSSEYTAWLEGMETEPASITPACPSPATNATCSFTSTASTSSDCAFNRGAGDVATYMIKGGPVQVAYWPVTAVGDLCGNRTTIQPNVTGPLTASVYGTTMTSPGVMLSISTLYAVDGCGNPVGTPISNFLLPQQTSQISSQCAPVYHAWAGGGQQVNFADYNSPIPASAYNCMPQCQGGIATAFDTLDFCTTFFDDDSRPYLAIPTDIFNIHTAWSDCILADPYDNANAMFDPPTALTPMSTEAAVTVPGAAQTTSASPASVVAQTTPQATSTPVAEADSNTTPAPSSAAQADPATASSKAADPAPASSSAADPDGAAAESQAQTSSSVDVGGIIASGLGTSTKASAADPAPSADPSIADPATSAGASAGDPATSYNAGGAIASLAGSGSSDSSAGNSESNGNGASGSVVATVGTQTVAVAADPSDSGAVVVRGTQTLQPGDTTVINNTPVSVGCGYHRQQYGYRPYRGRECGHSFGRSHHDW